MPDMFWSVVRIGRRFVLGEFNTSKRVDRARMGDMRVEPAFRICAFRNKGTNFEGKCGGRLEGRTRQFQS